MQADDLQQLPFAKVHGQRRSHTPDTSRTMPTSQAPSNETLVFSTYTASSVLSSETLPLCTAGSSCVDNSASLDQSLLGSGRYAGSSGSWMQLPALPGVPGSPVPSQRAPVASPECSTAQHHRMSSTALSGSSASAARVEDWRRGMVQPVLFPVSEQRKEEQEAMSSLRKASISTSLGRKERGCVIKIKDLALEDTLGPRAAAKVSRGTWRGSDIVAEEYMLAPEGKHQDDTSSGAASVQAQQQTLLQEAVVLRSLQHPNLVRFYGVCLDPLLVITELCGGGCVFRLLSTARESLLQPDASKHMDGLNWGQRLEVLYAVATGMQHLHAQGLLHGDLRSANVFLGSNDQWKVGGFASSTRLQILRGSRSAQSAAQPRWAAPEVLAGGQLTSAIDVYSFGVIMYELLTWNLPFQDETDKQVRRLVVAGGRPEVPPAEQLPPSTSNASLPGFVSLMQQCWSQEPEQRPTFTTVVRRLKAMERWATFVNKQPNMPAVQQQLQHDQHSSIGSSGSSGSSSSFNSEVQDQPPLAVAESVPPPPPPQLPQQQQQCKGPADDSGVTRAPSLGAWAVAGGSSTAVQAAGADGLGSSIQQLLAAAAALEQLQPNLPSVLGQLLLLWGLHSLHKTTTALQCAAQHCSSSSGRFPAATPDFGAGTTADITSAAVVTVVGATASLVQQRTLLENTNATAGGAGWVALLAALQLQQCCRGLQQLQEQLLGPKSSPGQPESKQLSGSGRYAGALAVAAVAAILLLPLHVVLLPLVAAVLLLGAAAMWVALSSHSQQQHQQLPVFTVYRALGEAPVVASAVVSIQPDATGSTATWTAWAVEAPTATEHSQASRGVQHLLMHTLPQHCFSTVHSSRHLEQPQCHGVEAQKDTLPDLDQQTKASQQPQLQQQTAAATADGFVSLPQHPVLSSPVYNTSKAPQLLLWRMQTLLQQPRDSHMTLLLPGWLQAAQQQDRRQLFVPVKWVCQDPPLLLQDTQPGSSLAAWLLGCQVQQQQQDKEAAGSSQAWSAPLPAVCWPLVLGWLLDVAAALQHLHKHQIIHGTVHATSVHLDMAAIAAAATATAAQTATTQAESAATAEATGHCRLSLVGPWLNGVTGRQLLDWCLAAPEQLHAEQPGSNSECNFSRAAAGGGSHSSASSLSPATDVHGLGLLMWQLATGWVPCEQQVGPPHGGAFDAATVEEVNWCNDMWQCFGTTFPGAADAAAGQHAGWMSSRSSTATPTGARADPHDLPARHGCLPSCADSWMPSGFRVLMYQCCRPEAAARPSLLHVIQQLQRMHRNSC